MLIDERKAVWFSLAKLMRDFGNIATIGANVKSLPLYKGPSLIEDFTALTVAKVTSREKGLYIYLASFRNPFDMEVYDDFTLPVTILQALKIDESTVKANRLITIYNGKVIF